MTSKNWTNNSIYGYVIMGKSRAMEIQMTLQEADKMADTRRPSRKLTH